MDYKQGSKQFAFIDGAGRFTRMTTPIWSEEEMQACIRKIPYKAAYQSVFHHPTWRRGPLTAEIAKHAVIDRVYLDFDCKEDPLRAIRDAGAIADFVGHSTNWFSGMKGAGVILHCNPVDIIPDLKGAALTRLALVLQDMFSNITTMDMAVTGDLNRVHRMIDSTHPGTGLHAIGLTGREMRYLSLEEITFMAQNTRGLVQRPKHSQWVAEELQRIEEELIIGRLDNLIDEGMIGAKNGYDLKQNLYEHESKLAVYEFILKLEEEVRRIRMKKLANMPATAGGSTPEETWLISTVSDFKQSGRVAFGTMTSEHKARVHLVKLANDCGWTFSEICDIFIGADDYDRKTTEGHVKSLLRG